jgi:fumarylacetoacetase
MIPLGPLNSKNSGTTLSPWIITYDAMEPFRVSGPGWKHALPPHLAMEKDNRGLSIDLSVYVQSKDGDVTRACLANSKVMAWSFEQLLAHQASAGCGLQAGDLLACGTVSEEGEDKRGCMLEHNLPPPEVQRGYLEDGVVVQFTGVCSEGVGFGDCRAELLPAKSADTWYSE